MTGTRPTTRALTQLWRSLTSGPAPTSPWGSAIRRGLVVAAIMAVGAALEELPHASVASIGALNLGLVAGAVPRRTLVRATLTVAVLTTVVTFVTALAAGTWWTVPLLVLIALITGTVTGSGMVALNAGFMSLVTAIVFTNDPSDVGGAAVLAGLVLLGSVIQAVASILAWDRERRAAVRRSVLVAAAAVTDFALAEDALESANLAAATAEIEAQQTLTAARLPAALHTAFATLLEQLTWTRMNVASWLATDSPTASQRKEVAAALNAVQADLHRRERTQPGPLPATSADGGDRQWRQLSDQLRVLDQCALILADTSRRPMRRKPTGRSDVSVKDRADRALTLGDRLAALAALFSPTQPMFAHGLRLAVAIGVAQSISVGFNVDRGYWIVLTVAMVVKPDFATTLTRALLRIVGTLASVAVVGVLLTMTGHATWLMIALVAVFTPLAMRWITGNYGLAAFAITTTVLVQIEAIAPSVGTVEQRLLMTLAGAVIAIAASTLWPRWRGDDVRQLLVRALRAQEAWTAAVLDTLDGGKAYSVEELRALGRTSRDAMLVARPAAEAALLEPHRASTDPQSAIVVLDFCVRAALATAALEVAVRSGPGDGGRLPVGEQHAMLGVRRRVAADLATAIHVVDPAAGPAQDVPGVVPEAHWPRSGDQVTDRALTQLVAAADGAALAARAA